MEEESLKWTCNTCGNVGLVGDADGYYYCERCGSQADDIIDTGVADEDFVDKGGDGRGALYSTIHRRSRRQPISVTQPISQFDPQSQFWSQISQPENIPSDHDQQVKREIEYYNDGVGPTGPSDFGSSGPDEEVGLGYEDYYNEVRMRYVMGVQLMVQFQCEALVEKFKVTPLICGFAGSIWLRYLASTGVMKEGWADEAIQESEAQKQGDSEDSVKPHSRYNAEPHNIHGQRAVIIWFRSLRKRIPLSISLAVSFLCCHVAREAVLPTDIVKWSLEGKLPYFTAFIEIQKQFGQSSRACPISSSTMFKPSEIIHSQKLESLSASIAQSIGLSLPPVNFHAIALRYLKQLAVPVEIILPKACRIYEWSMPPDLYISTNELRLPTRVCVLSILIVAIRIIYNIHGFGAWEKSLSKHKGSSAFCEEKLNSSRRSKMKDDGEEGSASASLNADDPGAESCGKSSHIEKSEWDASELLYNLEARYNEIGDTLEYSKDLPTYLKHCKDVVFAGLETPFEDYEEEKLIEQLWNIYQNGKDCEPSEDIGSESQKRLRDDERSINSLSQVNKKPKDDEASLGGGDHCSWSPQGDLLLEGNNQESSETFEERAIRRMKLDMEENRFCYIPPRVKVKRLDYLHYVRKRDEGSLAYVAHADYYILLRACAKIAKVDVRVMHAGILSFERRLAWLEKRIDYSLHLTPPNFTCEFCTDVPENASPDDPVGLSNLNLAGDA